MLLELVSFWYHIHFLQIPRNLDNVKISVSRKNIYLESFPHFLSYGTRLDRLIRNFEISIISCL